MAGTLPGLATLALARRSLWLRPAAYAFLGMLLAMQSGPANGQGMGGGGMGGGGMGGGGMGMCWVAREVYGQENPKWLQFRDWLRSDAPRWLHDAYAAHGEEFALWIHDKPAAKSAVRLLMDQAIK